MEKHPTILSQHFIFVFFLKQDIYPLLLYITY